ncbi:MAG: YfhO family protein, partial [Eubacteriales bacterium]|nr:YfhO family protein [Eubacteriales bacterium]
TINDASLYHYNGFSQFSSLAYGNTSKLIELLGIAATSNSYRYYDPTPLINAMFNIKYVMNKDGLIDSPDYEYLAEFNTVSLYKNPKHLSLGFMVNKNIENWNVNQNTPFLTQNEFVKKATNIKDNLTTPVDIAEFSFENINVDQDENIPTKYSYTLQNENNLNLVPKVYSKIINPKEQRLFLYVESPNSNRFKYTINGSTQDRELSTGRSLIDCGIVAEDEEINIEFTLESKGEHEKTYRPSGSFKLFAAGFEEEVFEEVYNELEDELLIVENYTSSKIEGKINVLNDGILFTSIPYDKSWKVFVDGNEVEPLKIANDGLIGINLTKGEHTIVCQYKTSGLLLGILLSLISFIGLILYIIYDSRSNKKQIS